MAIINLLLERVRRVGVLSLCALLVGSSITIFVGGNILYRDPEFAPMDKQQAFLPFHFGSTLSLQFWLAVTGIGFGCLAYGFSKTWEHLFDCLSSYFATSEKGLDYGRYLNTQPRAPVTYGWRGFRWMVTCRYLVIICSIVTSVGYKFAISYVLTFEIENLDPAYINLSVPPLAGMVNGIVSPWFSDYPENTDNRAFVHILGKNPRGETKSPYSPPKSIIMASLSNCSNLFSTMDNGEYVNRERVMVANATDETTSRGPYYMTSNHTRWMRIRSPGQQWVRLDHTTVSKDVIVDYQITAPGTITIQWADYFDSWDTCAALYDQTCDSSRYVVKGRIRYDMYYAVAEVVRTVRAGDCSFLPDDLSEVEGRRAITLLSGDTREFMTKYDDGSLELFRSWVDAIIYNRESTSRSGVSAFARAVMAGWASERVSDVQLPGLGMLSATQLPYGSELRGPLQSASPKSRYPFFYGERGFKRTGGSVTAAKVFICLGVFSFVVLIIRVCIGPPKLTSWMGQHVGLARNGGFHPSMTYRLADGHTSAEVNTEFLRLVTYEDYDSQTLRFVVAGHVPPTFVESHSIIVGK